MLYNVIFAYDGIMDKLLTAADSREEAIALFHESVFDFVARHCFDDLGDELGKYIVLGVEEAKLRVS